MEELRRRTPDLRKRQQSLKSELDSLEAAAVTQQGFLRLAENMEDFLGRLRKTAHSMDVVERQKILRLVVKEILIDLETIKIRHSIRLTGNSPESGTLESTSVPSYLLRSGSNLSAFGECIPSLV
ncbi:MAG: hypothetical protein U5R49_07480 [Deltaproteobacteria bacterium]|nr:hypothetical protein [Deltaproteobacteria bacterium]MDZ7696756.1 hypothetical protein [Deltaproteobacteria bacterium]